MMLRLAPQLVVGEVAKVPEVPLGKAFSPGYRAWVMPDRSEPGHIGNAVRRDRREGRGAVRALRRRRRRVSGAGRRVGRKLGLLIPD